MAGQDAPSFPNPFAAMVQFWTEAMRGAPANLTQPILPDWSLIRIDETNSSAPATERAIVEQESYGRQIGRIMDALAILIDRQPNAGDVEAFAEFRSIKHRIDAVKCARAADRIARLPDDLALLRTGDPAGYEAAMAILARLPA